VSRRARKPQRLEMGVETEAGTSTRQWPFIFKHTPKLADKRDFTGKTRSAARTFVTAAVAERRYWP
jgi:hypothetical protein